ncbi:hypothetical protein PILCRDRAFT_811923 [Piloderma croceum F 1598]|uniref:Uncharacterized protein n=1 Tax=Piloderma croceum (strain F 1598) TaxID=765440 RepID=A0A0C3G1Q0_PILCF|nr:hypothetical protein PILCRDRAFT_811923 [Piloderma croceum F 1598]
MGISNSTQRCRMAHRDPKIFHQYISQNTLRVGVVLTRAGHSLAVVSDMCLAE